MPPARSLAASRDILARIVDEAAARKERPKFWPWLRTYAGVGKVGSSKAGTLGRWVTLDQDPTSVEIGGRESRYGN